MEDLKVGQRVKRYFGKGNLYNCTFEIRGIVDDLYIVMRIKSGRYEMIHKVVMKSSFKDGDFKLVKKRVKP